MELQFRLLQARDSNDIARKEEHEAFASFLDVPLQRVESFDLLSEEITPDRVMEGVDAILVGGSGAYGVNDNVAWMRSYIDCLGAIADASFPMFASCFGFQGLCMALGADVKPDSEGAEVGTYEIHLTEAGETDQLFGTLPPRFMAQQGHKDRALVLPSDCTWLARSERCPFQAIRFRDNLIYATQFHPELDGEAQSSRFRNYFDLYKGVYGEARAREILEEICPSPEANALLLRFKELLGEKIGQN